MSSFACLCDKSSWRLHKARKKLPCNHKLNRRSQNNYFPFDVAAHVSFVISTYFFFVPSSSLLYAFLTLAAISFLCVFFFCFLSKIAFLFPSWSLFKFRIHTHNFISLNSFLLRRLLRIRFFCVVHSVFAMEIEQFTEKKRV